MVEHEQVAKMVAFHLGKKAADIAPYTTLASLDCDSLDRVELSMAAEDMFKISMPDNVEDRWQTVADITASIERAKAHA